MTQEARPGILSGLLENITSAAKNIVALGINRIELAAIELSELAHGAVKTLVMAFISLTALMFAILFWSGLIVVLAWDSMGWKILLVMAIFYTVVAAGLIGAIMKTVKGGKFGMPLTMEELRKDRDALM